MTRYQNYELGTVEEKIALLRSVLVIISACAPTTEQMLGVDCAEHANFPDHTLPASNLPLQNMLAPSAISPPSDMTGSLPL